MRDNYSARITTFCNCFITSGQYIGFMDKLQGSDNRIVEKTVHYLAHMNQLTETWEINARINLYLLDSLPEEALAAVAPSKGRTVGEQLAHMHNVRLMWLKAAAPELLVGLEKLEKGDVTKEVLKATLQQSQAAITQLIDKGAAEGKIKGFKPHPTAFVGYLIAHESHHRGQVMLILKLAGYKVDQKIVFGLWEWGVR